MRMSLVNGGNGRAAMHGYLSALGLRHRLHLLAGGQELHGKEPTASTVHTIELHNMQQR
jgi:hypothetical protein